MNNKFQTENKFYYFYLIGFFLILALPLLAVPPWFHPAAWGKTIIFRIIISILIFVFIWRALTPKFGSDGQILSNAKSVLCKKNKVFWPFWLLVALWAIFLLATIFSLDPYYSFWESPYRAGGFLNFSFYVIFAILTFFIIKPRDWQKIWFITIGIGILVSFITILQQFQVFSEILIHYTTRPVSTMGGAIFLALYLLLLTFITLSFFLRKKGIKKRLFYFSALLLFLYIILVTGTRAAYFGLLIGFFYFILCFPKKQRLVVLLKILFLMLLIVGAYGVYYLNNHQANLPSYLQENKTLQQILPRLSIDLALEDPRFSAWLVSFEAVKEKPILGYGPENFSIGFDKHYDHSLPYITKAWGSWWDRAHSFLFDISVTAGIPALIIYLSLFAALFWGLQKVKYNPNNSDALICHGIQATFFAYLSANLFSFDVFSTYLILFLLIGYSLYLIARSQKSLIKENHNRVKNQRNELKPLWKSGLIFGLFCLLIWFLWAGALKPLQINKEINWANHYLETGRCEKAIKKMEKILPSHSVIDSYLRLSYTDVLTKCMKKNPETKLALNLKLYQILKESAELRPNYTRSWWFLGIATNFLINHKNEYTGQFNIEELKKEANVYFEKANQLSPKREQILQEWAATNLLTGEYQKTKEKAQKCLDLNPDNNLCWWQKALANIYLGEFEQADKNIAIAIEKGLNPNSGESLSQLQKAYIKALETIKDTEDKIECYERLADVFRKLIVHIDSENFQYHASLAYVYKELGEYDKAREEAMIVLELSPESKQAIEEFLRTLP